MQKTRKRHKSKTDHQNDNQCGCFICSSFASFSIQGVLLQCRSSGNPFLHKGVYNPFTRTCSTCSLSLGLQNWWGIVRRTLTMVSTSRMYVCVCMCICSFASAVICAINQNISAGSEGALHFSSSCSGNMLLVLRLCLDFYTEAQMFDMFHSTNNRF